MSGFLWVVLSSPGHREFCPYHFVWYNWFRQNQDMSFPRLDKVFVCMPSRPIWDEFPLSKMIYLLNDLYNTCRAFLTISWRGGIHWTIHFRIWITKSKHRNGSDWTLNLARGSYSFNNFVLSCWFDMYQLYRKIAALISIGGVINSCDIHFKHIAFSRKGKIWSLHLKYLMLDSSWKSDQLILINPWTPMSDQDRISPSNNNIISSRKVMRIRKNIS